MAFNHWRNTQAIKRNGVANAPPVDRKYWFFVTPSQQMELDANIAGRAEEGKHSEYLEQTPLPLCNRLA
jgi:hypothetical protein